MNLPSKSDYRARCELRYGGKALHDAINNYDHFAQLFPQLSVNLKDFHNNPFLEDQSGNCHNPSGSLPSLLWHLQDAWQPDKSRLDPFLDFEDFFQKVFLRRGLVIFCELCLESLDKPTATDDNQMVMFQ